jgi:hypothetical protein
MSTEFIANQLENYLSKLHRMQEQWSQWIQSADVFGRSVPSDEVTDFQRKGQVLLDKMGEIVAIREGLLVEARELGFPAGSLSTLVAWLPAAKWKHLHTAVHTAQRQMEQLKRIQIAAWVTLRESAEFCNDSLMLLMCGQTQSDLTIDHAPPEMGGQLLDADL